MEGCLLLISAQYNFAFAYTTTVIPMGVWLKREFHRNKQSHCYYRRCMVAQLGYFVN